MNMRLLALPLAFICVAAPRAQDPEAIRVRWKDGRSANAQVLGIEGDKARLKLFIMEGTMVVTNPLADFAPESAFAIETAAAKPESFEDQFGLAKKAADMGLIPQAGARARAAIEAAKGTADAAAKESELRGWAAGVLEGKLEEAVAAGNLRDAKRFLQLLTTRLPDQRTEAQLDALAASVDRLEAQATAKRQADRQAQLDAKAKAEIVRRLEPIQSKMAAGDKLLRDSYTKAKNTGAAAQASTKAIAEYKAAWKAAQALGEKYPDDAELQAEVASIGDTLHDHAIRAALQAANVLTIQGDYRGALDWANRIIAFDPDNAEAKEMLRTIQLASAASSGDWAWGWRVGY
jgi:hypothetical protein